jgi:FkbM family methyltransferase
MQRPGWWSEGHIAKHQEWPRAWKGIPHPNSDCRGQDKEDRYLYETLFYQHMGGSYLEIGGHDGQHLSNTLWLHEQLGWRGMLVEANPLSYNQLATNRPADVTVHTAICKNASIVHYAAAGGGAGVVSGIYEFMSEEFKQQWWPHLDVSNLLEINCLPLGDILGMLSIRHFNFFSLDVEGAELQVLESIDLNCVSFDVI